MKKSTYQNKKNKYPQLNAHKKVCCNTTPLQIKIICIAIGHKALLCRKHSSIETDDSLYLLTTKFDVEKTIITY